MSEGWYWDKGDPSVGIFGDQWVHEDCNVLAGPGYGDVQGVEDDGKQIGDVASDGTVVMLHHLKCKDCREETFVESVEFVGVEEEEEAAA